MPADPTDTPEIVTVGEGFCVRQGVDNIAWIDLGEFAVVVDALEHARLEAEVFAAIESTLGAEPVRYLINTHTHCDHVALNGAFRRRYGTEIVNQRTVPIPADGRWFEGSRRKLLMLPLPGCHSNEDCIVWAPKDRALFTGDLFGWGLIPIIRVLDAETAGRLLDAYARMIEFDAGVVIPGHGPLCTTAELKRWVEYFNRLIEQVRGAVAAGRDDTQIAREIAPPADMRTWWRFVQWKHEDSLAKVLSAVRHGRLEV